MMQTKKVEESLINETLQRIDLLSHSGWALSFQNRAGDIVFINLIQRRDNFLGRPFSSKTAMKKIKARSSKPR
jgi:hypothetical protein